ncbi:MAG: hypothetical protein GY895_06210 [Phycisphaera sp.]|nr:hypothetical protein [Phycisphaera sp.]
MPRSKNSTSSKRSSRSESDSEERRFEPTVIRRSLWLVGLASWLFLVVAVLGADWADLPSTAVSAHHAEIANPAGPVGATLAWWSFRVFGPGTWLLLSLGGIGLITLARGITIPHPIVRVVGAVLAAVTISGLHHGVIASSESLGSLAGGIPGLPSGLLGAELELGLVSRFGPVGSMLILLLGFGLGLLVAADELVLAFPAAVLRSFRSLRGFASNSQAAIGPVASMIATARRTIRRPSLQPAGVPAEYLDYEEEEEEEEEEEDDDEYEYEDEEEDDDEDEDAEYEDEYEDEEEEEEEEEEEA